ncbi:hypothetical protein GH714_043772 [Hevea brasiliensis]|uniref:Uncharacterized protein n=1 Tax=Hevea brasiliensis TaxID=3981 RepID=A0A6A6K1P5_HEVBR|nr:hypothetical protein GH714_043772 [Hevea brasiliensis]
MHRVVGSKGSFMMDQEMDYGVRDDVDSEGFGLMGKDEGDLQLSVLQQVQELRNEIGLLEGRLRKIPSEFLASVSQELFDVVNKVRSMGEDSSKTIGLLSHKPHADDVLVGDNDLPHWSDHHHERIYGNGKETELIDDDEDSFGRTLGDCDFDEKSILDCEDTKLTKPMRHDEAIVTDVGLIQVDSFYQENPKWYDSPCGLDSSADCGDSGFRHGEIV